MIRLNLNYIEELISLQKLGVSKSPVTNITCLERICNNIDRIECDSQGYFELEYNTFRDVVAKKEWFGKSGTRKFQPKIRLHKIVCKDYWEPNKYNKETTW